MVARTLTQVSQSRLLAIVALAVLITAVALLIVSAVGAQTGGELLGPRLRGREELDAMTAFIRGKG